MRKLAVVMDPLNTLKIKGDTSLALLAMARQRGWEMPRTPQGGAPNEMRLLRGL